MLNTSLNLNKSMSQILYILSTNSTSIFIQLLRSSFQSILLKRMESLNLQIACISSKAFYNVISTNSVLNPISSISRGLFYILYSNEYFSIYRSLDFFNFLISIISSNFVLFLGFKFHNYILSLYDIKKFISSLNYFKSFSFFYISKFVLFFSIIFFLYFLCRFLNLISIVPNFYDYN
jgi:hypothetical protein